MIPQYATRFQNFPQAPSWWEWFEDFSNENGIDGFTTTALASGTGAVTLDRAFGWYRMSGNATSDNSGFQLQGDMESVSLIAGKKTYFMSRFQTSDATQSEVWAGISITDTTVLDGTGTLAAGLTPTDCIGFYKPDGQATFYGVVRRDSVQLSVGPFDTTLANDTNMELSFEVVMDSVTSGKGIVRFYINGRPVGQIDSSTMPYDTEEILTPSLSFVTGDASGTKTCDWDYVGVMQER